MKGEMVDDYVARLNIEGERKVWLGNHPKIKYVFTQSKKYLKSGMLVGEIGIGDGYLLRLLSHAGLKVTGIDTLDYLITKLGSIFKDEGLEIGLLQQDISKSVDLKDNFEVVFCLDILEHVEHLGEAIKNIKKILKPGGVLIATLPWKENMDNNMVACPKCYHRFHRIGHFHSFHSCGDIRQMLGDNFSIISFGFIPARGYQNLVIALLKKTLLRINYYQDGLPDFQTTCFWVARLDKNFKQTA